MRPKYRVIEGFSGSLEKEFEKLILSSLYWKEIARGGYVKKGDIINKLVNDLCDDKNHLHTVKCFFATEAFNQNSNLRKWNLELDQVFNYIEQFYSLPHENNEYPLCHAKVNGKGIESVSVHVLGYLLGIANQPSSNKYIYTDQVNSISGINLAFLTPFNVLLPNQSSHILDIGKFPTIMGDGKSDIFGLHINSFNIYGDTKTKKALEECFIENCNISMYQWNPFNLEFNCIKNSRINLTISEEESNKLLNWCKNGLIGISNNDIYSSDIGIYIDEKQNQEHRNYYITDCNFNNSIIRIDLNKKHWPHPSSDTPIGITFKDCHFNNSVINNLVSKYNINVKFDNCIFSNIDFKFEIEELT